ncbi:MAG TPA: class I SAM-dependent methyltransferase [Methylomirabilota bacterium]|nr:class I SAM-dependent methyltransferase [Methylomirabilota bacterium]
MARVSAGGLPRSEFWTDRTVAWYARALERSDYAARVLEVLGPYLGRCRDALDVGAGCGVLALPLARRLERVTAVEPSHAMASALRRAAARAVLANLTVVEAAWGEAPVAPHDLVLCSHVGGLMKAGSPFLSEAGGVARRVVALIRDWPSGQRDDKFFFSELYPRLLGRPYEHRCDAEETLEALERLGIHPRVTVIQYSSDQPFTDLDEACDFWMTYLGLEGQEPRGWLEGFLRERLTRRDGEWVAPFSKSAAVLLWETAGRRGR